MTHAQGPGVKNFRRHSAERGTLGMPKSLVGKVDSSCKQAASTPEGLRGSSRTRTWYLGFPEGSDPAEQAHDLHF